MNSVVKNTRPTTGRDFSRSSEVVKQFTRIIVDTSALQYRHRSRTFVTFPERELVQDMLRFVRYISLQSSRSNYLYCRVIRKDIAYWEMAWHSNLAKVCFRFYMMSQTNVVWISRDLITRHDQNRFGCILYVTYSTNAITWKTTYIYVVILDFIIKIRVVSKTRGKETFGFGFTSVTHEVNKGRIQIHTKKSC